MQSQQVGLSLYHAFKTTNEQSVCTTLSDLCCTHASRHNHNNVAKTHILYIELSLQVPLQSDAVLASQLHCPFVKMVLMLSVLILRDCSFLALLLLLWCFLQAGSLPQLWKKTFILTALLLSLLMSVALLQSSDCRYHKLLKCVGSLQLCSPQQCQYA